MSDVISVIIPVYNAERSLNYCLNSLVSQNCLELEIILVDDGSQDQSGRICDEYAQKDARIKVIHKKNEGVSIARNTGVLSATGKYIIFIDSDDYIADDFFLKIHKVLNTEKEDAFIWWGYKKVFGYGARKSPDAFVLEEQEAVKKYKRQDFLLLYQKWLLNSPCNKLYERKVIIENHIQMREELSLGEDLLFNLNYLDCVGEKNIVILNDPIYFYVIGDKESLSNREYPERMDILKMLYKHVLTCAKKWGAEAGIRQFYSIYFEFLLTELEEAFKVASADAYWTRIKRMNCEMQKTEFVECVRNKNVKYSKIIEWSFRHHNYAVMRLGTKIEEIKKVIRQENG